MESPGRRFVSFVVADDDLAGPEIGGRLGVEGDVVRTRGQRVTVGRLNVIAPGNSWEVHSRLDPSVVIEEHLSALYGLVLPLEPGLQQLAAEGCRSILQIVQYMPKDQPTGYGIALEGNWIKLLAGVKGSLSIDLYVETDDDGE